MLGLGLGLGAVRRGASFNPATLFAGQAGGWYDPSDSTTLFQDSAGATPVTASGQSVGRISDKSGNGNHLIQATGGRLPIYQDDASGKYLLFDGIDDVLGVTRAITMPFDRLTALRQVTWVLNRYVYFAASSAGQLYQNTATPDLRISSGTTTNTIKANGLAVGSNGVVTERHIANASKIAVNSGAYVTGDAGAVAPTSLNLGASGSATAASNVRFYGAVERAGSMTDSEIAQLRTWLGAKCGVTL